jgi:hypothetical protein
MFGRGLLLILLLILAVVVVTALLTSNTPLLPSEELAGGLVNTTESVTEGISQRASTILDRVLVTPRSAIIRALLIVGGLLLLVAGWRIYDYIIVIAGIVIGATVALSLVTTTDTLVNIGAMVIGGLIGALVGVFLYYVAVFFVGAYFGIVLTGAIVDALSTTEPSSVVLLIGGILGGLILLGLSFEFLVLISALVGAQMLALGLGLSAIWTLVFAIIGVIVQLMMMRRFNYAFRRRPRRLLLTSW